MTNHPQIPVLVTLDHGLTPIDTPIVHADDLGLIRGDGVFETIRVREGIPWLLPEHLVRLTNSAAILDMTIPPHPALTSLVTQACQAWHGDPEAALRLICTRGRESGGPPTVFATIGAIPPQHVAARHTGLTVRTATLGLALPTRTSAPWLLAGAKTLSYAVNLATQRWGAAHGADDVLWTSTEGYALEAPTSTLMWLDNDTLCTTPPDITGVLPGTVAAWLLDHASDLGWQHATHLIRPEQLPAMTGVWMTSSVRGAAAIRVLDGIHLPETHHTRRILDLLGYAV